MSKKRIVVTQRRNHNTGRVIPSDEWWTVEWSGYYWDGARPGTWHGPFTQERAEAFADELANKYEAEGREVSVIID